MPASRRGGADVADGARQAPCTARLRARLRRTFGVGRLLAERAGVTAARVLEAEPLVERVRVIAALGGREVEQLASPRTRFRLHCLDKGPADAAAAVPIVDDESADLRRRALPLDRR